MIVTNPIRVALKTVFGADYGSNEASIDKWAVDAPIGLVEYDKALTGESKAQRDKRLACNEVYNETPNVHPLAEVLRDTYKDKSHLSDWEIVFDVYKSIKNLELVSGDKDVAGSDRTQTAAERQKNIANVQEEKIKKTKETDTMATKNTETKSAIEDLNTENNSGVQQPANPKETQVEALKTVNSNLDIGDKYNVIAAMEAISANIEERVTYTMSTKVENLISKGKPVVDRLVKKGTTRVGSYSLLNSGKKLETYIEEEMNLFKERTGYAGSEYKVGDPIPTAVGVEGQVQTFQNYAEVLRFMYPTLANCTEAKVREKDGVKMACKVNTLENLAKADAFRRALEALKAGKDIDFHDVVLPPVKYTFNGAVITDRKDLKNAPLKADDIADVITKYAADKIFIDTPKVDDEGRVPANTPVLQLSELKTKKKDTSLPGEQVNIVRKTVARLKNGSTIVTNEAKFKFAFSVDTSASTEKPKRKFVMGMPQLNDKMGVEAGKLTPASYYYWKEGKIKSDGKEIKAGEGTHKIQLGVEYYPLQKTATLYTELKLEAPKDVSIGMRTMAYDVESTKALIDDAIKAIKNETDADKIAKIAGRMALVKIAAAAAAGADNFNVKTDALAGLAKSVSAQKEKLDKVGQAGADSDLNEG